MKAVILAGGEGTRLRPITVGLPKPMVTFFDKPLILRTIRRLRESGIDDICLTLRYLPGLITDCIEDSGVSGVTWRIESEPLGTAGSVKACCDFLGDEDFLVVSGDGVFDFDLRRAIEFHREKNAEATVLLCRHPDPPEYGLVLTEKDGRISRFIEKPAWDGVVTDLVNTGIYIFSGGAAEKFPAEGDFGRDVFPSLLNSGQRLYGYEAKGFWRDIGSCGEYLRAMGRVLEGGTGLTPEGEFIRTGVISSSPVPDSAVLDGPLYIGKNVRLGENVKIGPGSVIGGGSSIEDGANIRRSFIDGANIGTGASLTGAIVCRRASVGAGVTIGEDAVIGEGTVIGRDARIMSGVKIWPGREVKAGSKITSSITEGSLLAAPAVDSVGAIRGDGVAVITPELCIRLGGAMAQYGRVAVGCGADPMSQVRASAIVCGVRSSGGDADFFSGEFPAVGAYAAKLLMSPLTAFVSRCRDGVAVRFFDALGQKPARDIQRKLEAASSGDVLRSGASGTGRLQEIASVYESYVSAAARAGKLSWGQSVKISAAVEGSAPECQALCDVFRRMGVKVVPERRGVPVFSPCSGGFLVRARDENGGSLDSMHLLLILALIEFENGSGAVAVSDPVPGALTILANDIGGRIYRPNQPGYRELCQLQPFFHDGVFAAARIAAGMAARGETLAELSEMIPKFSTFSREVTVYGDRGRVMRRLTEKFPGSATDKGLCINLGSGGIFIRPDPCRPVLRLRAECETTEAARELCDDARREIRNFDLTD